VTLAASFLLPTIREFEGWAPPGWAVYAASITTPALVDCFLAALATTALPFVLLARLSTGSPKRTVLFMIPLALAVECGIRVGGGELGPGYVAWVASFGLAATAELLPERPSTGTTVDPRVFD